MGILELFKVIGNRIKNAMEVTFSNQDFVGEDAVENLEIAVLTTPGVDNTEGSELIKKLKDVEKRNKHYDIPKKLGLGKNRTTSGKGVSNISMQDATIKGIKDGVTTLGKYNNNSATIKETSRTEVKFPSEREDY